MTAPGMNPSDADHPDLCVLLTPRALGGHEVALLGWLADAVRLLGLRPRIVAPTPALQQACIAQGLGPCLWPPAASGPTPAPSRRALLACLRAWPRQRPLLLAPGVLHVDTWLLAAAALRRQALWLYVPMTHTARHMGYRAGWWRDQLLRPWLRAVRGWVVIQPEQATALARTWGSRAPAHVLPNLARVDGPAPPPPAPAADGRLRVAVVGRLALQQKGLDWLARLLAQGPDWAGHCQWHFQGQGPGAPVLQALVHQLGPDRARLVPHAPLDQALAVNDVLLLPSRYEGLPLVALEATARGWPVVASRQAGLGALLPARSQFEFGDAAGLAQALDSLRCPRARAQAVAHTQARCAALTPPQRYHQALQRLVQALRGAPAEARPC